MPTSLVVNQLTSFVIAQHLPKVYVVFQKCLSDIDSIGLDVVNVDPCDIDAIGLCNCVDCDFHIIDAINLDVVIDAIGLNKGAVDIDGIGLYSGTVDVNVNVVCS